MRIVVCGAGSTGRHVAQVLGQVHDVTVIDLLEERRVAGRRFVLGDAADPVVLLDAGAADADALVAATADDATNLVIALLSKRRLRVGSTVARMSDPAHRWLFTPAAGVDVVVSAAELVARLLQEEVTAGDLVTLLELRGGGVAVTETTIPAGAAVAGRRVTELAVPEGAALTAVVREDQVLLPERAGALRARDIVVALCEPGREHVLHDLLTGR
ncbi:MAG TPA: NAD-binding protein [Solirubrobacteraceae bacterium]|nr:NAD-binding protein [Solirubrobacteraceae bacterium]